MSNIEITRRQWTVLEFSIPTPGVNADVRAAYTAAERACRDMHDYHEAAALSDDAFRVEVRDDRIVFIVSQSSPMP